MNNQKADISMTTLTVK